MPYVEAGLFRDVLKDNWARFHESAGGDGALLGVEDWSENSPGCRAALFLDGLGFAVAAIDWRLGWRLGLPKRKSRRCRNAQCKKTT